MKVQLVNPNFKEDYVDNLLRFRGVEDVVAYYHPSSEYLSSYDLLDNMMEGYNLFTNTLNKNGKIALVVDCDVDGFTSSTVIYQYIKKINPDIEITYFLHEHKAHGLQDVWQDIYDGDFDLVITPDAGSNDYPYHEKFKEIDLPVLVLDHHELDNEVSDNCVLINNQTSSRYTNKQLTGVGVTWQFCRFCDNMNGTDYAEDMIDLVALGVCADMGSVLTMENRYIMTAGFSKVKNIFFKEIIDKQSFSMKGEVNPVSVAFYVVPMINALIRVGTMDEKQRLFTSFINPDVQVPCNKRGAKGTTERCCIETIRECTNARTHQNAAIDAMADKLEGRICEYDLLSNKILFIRLDDSDNLPSEITGLLAMKLSKKYKHPTIVARLNDEGYDRGSARGLDACALKDFKAFLTESGMFEYNLGHANAFGTSIKDKSLSAFHDYANRVLADVDFGENVYDINFERISSSEDLEDLICEIAVHPDLWGQQNDEPVIHIKDIVFNYNDVQIMGKNKDTVKICSHGVAYMKFFGKEFIEELEMYKGKSIRMHVVGTANLNEWGGMKTAQIFIKNYELEEDDGF